jgi:hypothetical protein
MKKRLSKQFCCYFFRGRIIQEGEFFEDVAERAGWLMYEVKRSGKSDYCVEGLASETES